MPDWTTYLLIVGLVIVGLAIANHRNPSKVNNYWKAATTALVLGALWVWQERLSSLGQTFGLEGLFTVGLLVAFGFVLWGVYTRKPVGR